MIPAVDGRHEYSRSDLTDYGGQPRTFRVANECLRTDDLSMSEKKKETEPGGGDRPLKYEYEFDLEGDSSAAKVIRMVKDGSRVLEIGAGPGSITQELKHKNNCHVTALDIDQKFVEKLAAICDAAYQVDLNDSNWPRLLEKDEKFDVVIAADILEHLWDPWKTLSLIRSLIKEDGEIIISLPHVGHCAVTACLINRNFDYRDEGLLDRTHIRFFGLKNIQSLINDADLNIYEAQFVVKRPESTELANQWSLLTPEMRQSLLSNKHSLIYKVIVKAKAKKEKGKNLRLEKLNIEEPRVGLFVRLVPIAAVRIFLKTKIKSLISVNFRRKLRWLMACVGIRF